MPRNDVEVRAAGQLFTAWESVAVTRDVLACSGVVALEAGRVSPWPFRPGTSLEVRFAGVPLLTGFVDRADLTPHARTVVGRDATEDLVDCDPDPAGPRRWTDAPLDVIARDLAGAFGLAVVVQGELGAPFPTFAVAPGEKCWAAIERALRLRGLLGFSPGDGSLVLKAPSTTRSSVGLREGLNLEDWEVSENLEDRFSDYYVLAQRPTTGADFGGPANEANGSAHDPEVPRVRPFVSFAEAAADDASAQARAEWELTMRRARGRSVTATVRDWCKARAPDGTPGELWRPDELVAVEIPSLELAGDWYVQSVSYHRRARQGTTAELKLVRPDVFVAEPARASDDPFRGVFGEGDAGAPEPDFPEDSSG